MQRQNPNQKRGISRYSALSGRIANLLNIFGDGKPHKAAELAQVVGVNSRTIRRTLHMMRDEIGIPLEATRQGFCLKNLHESSSNEPVALGASAGNSPLSVASTFWQSAFPQRN